LMDLTKDDPELVTILDNEKTDTYVIKNEGSKLFIVTNLDAPNKKIVSVDSVQKKKRMYYTTLSRIM